MNSERHSSQFHHRPPRDPRKAEPRRAADGPSARYAALLALEDVLNQGAYISEAIDRQLKANSFSQLDRRLCSALVYTTVENLLAIDHIISAFVEELSSLEPRTLNVLRLAVCQKAFMDRIPDNAIADEAVKLERRIGLEKLTGFVNAVVRNYLRDPERVRWPDEAADPIGCLSLRYSMPRWIVEKLSEGYGFETAKQVIQYRPSEHDITLRPNLTALDDAQFERLLAAKVWQSHKGKVPHAYHISGVMEIARDRDYLAGQYSIEGEASMLCAQLTGVRPGIQALDCCAAPGGKTALMAELMQGTGRVFAWDVHEHRVALIQAMKRRLRLDNVRPAVHDATKPKTDLFGSFDVVLLDAPCSGLGVISDKPDVKYRATAESVSGLTTLQAQLLSVCSQYVKKGGTFLYSTCSILPEENEAQVESFLSAHPEFALRPLPEWALKLYPGARNRCGLQLLAGINGDEGFYIAPMVRK